MCIALGKLHFLEPQTCWQPGSPGPALRWASATCPLVLHVGAGGLHNLADHVAAFLEFQAPCRAVWSLDWGQYGVRHISPGERTVSGPQAVQSNRCPQLPRRLLFAAIVQALLVFLLEPGVPKPLPRLDRYCCFSGTSGPTSLPEVPAELQDRSHHCCGLRVLLTLTNSLAPATLRPHPRTSPLS